MSNDLLELLENKVFSTIETIELMRLEINELKEDRHLMESKVRDLIERIEGADTNARTTSISATTDEAADLDGSSALGKTGTNF